MSQKGKRQKFVVSTSGVILGPDPGQPYVHLDPPRTGDAEDILNSFVNASRRGITAIVHAHHQRAVQFIAAVASGIGKKPEQLVVDCYKDFVALLDRWAANEKARYTVGPKIRLGGQFNIGVKEGEYTGQESAEETTEEPATEEFQAYEPPRKTTSTPQDWELELEEKDLRNAESNNLLSLEDYGKLFREYWTPERVYALPRLDTNTIFFNYLKYVIIRSREPPENNLELIAKLGIMVLPFGKFTMRVGKGPSAVVTDFEEFFMSNAAVRLVALKQTATPAPAMPSSAPPIPASTPLPPISAPQDLKKIVDALLEASEQSVQASNLVEYYKYLIIPNRYGTLLFGPDLINGIGQAMQRLREAYKFTRTNDELFVDFLDDERWRDLFVALVVGVINLQRKIASFNPPQGLIRMIQSNIELTVGKFSDFKKFKR